MGENNLESISKIFNNFKTHLQKKNSVHSSQGLTCDFPQSQ